MAHRVRQRGEIEQHRNLAAGVPGEREGMFHERIGEAASVGRIGHDVLRARSCFTQEVDAACPEIALHEIRRHNLVPCRFKHLADVAAPAGGFPHTAIERLHGKERTGCRRRCRIEFIRCP